MLNGSFAFISLFYGIGCFFPLLLLTFCIKIQFTKWEKKIYICSQHENILFKRRLNRQPHTIAFIYLFSFSPWMTSVIAALCHISFVCCRLLLLLPHSVEVVVVFSISLKCFCFRNRQHTKSKQNHCRNSWFGGVHTFAPFHLENLGPVIMVKLHVYMTKSAILIVSIRNIEQWFIFSAKLYTIDTLKEMNDREMWLFLICD